MSRPGSTTAILGAALLALLSLGGCNGRQPEAAPPPPMASAPAPAAAPDLMGGPVESAAPRDQPASVEPPADGQRAFTPMAPVANPEDMAPEQRVQVYGHRYDRLSRHHGGRFVRRHSVRYYVGDGPGRAIHHRFGRRGQWRIAAHGRRRHNLHHAFAHEPQAARTAHHRHKTRSAPVTSSSALPSATAATASVATPATPAPAPAAPDAQAGSPSLDWLSIPGTPYIRLLGFRHVPSKYLTAAGLLLLAIVLLAVAAGRGRTATPRRRPVRNTVGAGPTFAEEPRVETAPVASFPHHESDDPTLPPR